jgi:nicotinate phosphoribosyltransferase
LIIFSDGLDTKTIIDLYQKFNKKVKIGFGWGTLLTNDFRGLIDHGALDPFSLVCKAVSANGRPTVKLSDNANKAMGPKNKIEQYKKIFGLTEQSKENLIV